MKIKEIMDRAGIRETGRAIAYIKDALEEINLQSETHVRTERIDITSDQRFYNIPNEAVKLIDIRCKNHNNEDNKYRSIPRSIYRPEVVDEDGN
tara:strand:- start:391 stop:672 length:282 start_codon:yes stop_codon:yes gene_type:complete